MTLESPSRYRCRICRSTGHNAATCPDRGEDARAYDRAREQRASEVRALVLAVGTTEAARQLGVTPARVRQIIGPTSAPSVPRRTAQLRDRDPTSGILSVRLTDEHVAQLLRYAVASEERRPSAAAGAERLARQVSAEGRTDPAGDRDAATWPSDEHLRRARERSPGGASPRKLRLTPAAAQHLRDVATARDCDDGTLLRAAILAVAPPPST